MAAAVRLLAVAEALARSGGYYWALNWAAVAVVEDLVDSPVAVEDLAAVAVDSAGSVAEALAVAVQVGRGN